MVSTLDPPANKPAVERRTEKLDFTKAKFAVKKAKRKQRRLDDLARIREARHNLDREQERVERAYVNDMERMGQAEAGSERAFKAHNDLIASGERHNR